jgi:hypothetical protein
MLVPKAVRGRSNVSHCVPQGCRHNATSLQGPEHHQRVDISPRRVIKCEWQSAADLEPERSITFYFGLFFCDKMI